MTTESRAWAGRLGNRDRAGPFQATVLRAPATRARNGPRPSSSVMIGRRARRPLDAAQTGPCTPHDRRPPLGPHWHVPIQLKTRTRTCHDCLLCSVILWLGAGPGRSRPGGTSTSTGSHHPESILPTDWPGAERRAQACQSSRHGPRRWPAGGGRRVQRSRRGAAESRYSESALECSLSVSHSDRDTASGRLAWH